MSAHCLSVSVVRASNQPHPHTMHGCSSLDSNHWECLLVMKATVAQRKANRGRTRCSLATGAETRKEWSAGTGVIHPRRI